MNKYLSKNPEILREQFFLSFSAALQSVESQERIVVGLSGGSSLKIFYEELRNRYHEIMPSIREKLFFCLLDERVVDFNDDFSNFKGLKKAFLDELVEKQLLKEENILLPDFTRNKYEKNYSELVGKIDIGLFGVGEDGHICSLFPHHELLENKNCSYLKIDNSPKPPPERITVSVPMIEDISQSFIFFMGEGKRAAYDHFVNPSMSVSNCPAKLVLRSKNTVVFSDLGEL